MSENKQNALPSYFTGPQFGVKNTDEGTRKHAADFFQYHYTGEKPKTAKEFLLLLFNQVAVLSGKLASVNTTEVEALKTEVEKLKAENDQLKTENANLKAETAPAPTEIQIPKSEISLFEDPKLFFLKEYLNETEDKTEAGAVLAMKKAYDNTIIKIIHDPLMLLEDEEYKALKKWDDETFLPGIEALLTEELKAKYQIDDIKKELTARHKFMMFWAFVVYDPAEKLEALIPNLTPEQKTALQEMRFPIQSHFENVLQDILLKKTQISDDIPQPVQQETTDTSTDTGKIIELNPAAALPAETSAGTDGPE